MPADTIEFHLDDLSADVRNQIYAHVFSSRAIEVGGVLFGTVDEDSGRPVVVGVVEALEAEGARASVTFTHDAWETIIDTQERDFPDTQIVGWYHSHPGFGIFLSEQDIFIQEHFFSERHQFAYVVDPVDQTEGVFGWRDGQIVLFDDAPVEGWSLTSAPDEPVEPAKRMVVDIDEDPHEAPTAAAVRPIASPEVGVPRRRNDGGVRTVVSLDEPEKKKSRKGLMAAAAALVAIVIVGGVALAGQGTADKGPGEVGGVKNVGDIKAAIASQTRALTAAAAGAEIKLIGGVKTSGSEYHGQLARQRAEAEAAAAAAAAKKKAKSGSGQSSPGPSSPGPSSPGPSSPGPSSPGPSGGGGGDQNAGASDG